MHLGEVSAQPNFSPLATFTELIAPSVSTSSGWVVKFRDLATGIAHSGCGELVFLRRDRSLWAQVGASGSDIELASMVEGAKSATAGKSGDVPVDVIGVQPWGSFVRLTCYQGRDARSADPSAKRTDGARGTTRL